MDFFSRFFLLFGCSLGLDLSMHRSDLRVEIKRAFSAAVALIGSATISATDL